MGKISEFFLPTSEEFPFNITAGPDGNVWFAETGTNNGPSKLGRVTPQGQISEFTLPHYLLNSITSGPDGALWFTEGQFNGTGKIGRVTTAGQISEFPLPTPGSSPGSITTGLDRVFWFTESHSNGTGKIGQLV